MKIIHCADVHLDSPLGTHLDSRRAAARNAELTGSFLDLLHRAAETNVDAVIIAGDLFDGRAERRTMDLVLDAIASTPRVQYFCLRGNHDRENAPEEVPGNLHLFSHRWQYFDLGEVVIAGVELTGENQDQIYDSLALSEDRCNLVVLHGQVGSGAGCIQLSRLREKHIDYLALGHVHSFATGRLDSRGIWCYSGCLEGRGFDECGEKGFVLLNVGGGKVETEFVPFAARTLYDVPVDITGLTTVTQIQGAMDQAAAGISGDALVKFTLTGAYTLETQKDLRFLRKGMEHRFWFVKVKDESRFKIEKETYEHDVSLKGEFIRLVMASDKSEAEKAQIICCGIQALSGEEVIL